MYVKEILVQTHYLKSLMNMFFGKTKLTEFPLNNGYHKYCIN